MIVSPAGKRRLEQERDLLHLAPIEIGEEPNALEDFDRGACQGGES